MLISSGAGGYIVVGSDGQYLHQSLFFAGHLAQQPVLCASAKQPLFLPGRWRRVLGFPLLPECAVLNP